MSYALFLKKPETTVAEDEPYDLTELMQLMQGDYDIIRDYFQTEENKEPAVEAAKKGFLIIPKNSGRTSWTLSTRRISALVTGLST